MTATFDRHRHLGELSPRLLSTTFSMIEPHDSGAFYRPITEGSTFLSWSCHEASLQNMTLSAPQDIDRGKAQFIQSFHTDIHA